MRFRETRAGFSPPVQAAGTGGPASALMSVPDAHRLHLAGKPNLGAFLATYPGGTDLERNQSPAREIDL